MIHFTGFANVAAFDQTAKNNVRHHFLACILFVQTFCQLFKLLRQILLQFITAIESPLKAAGYNVQVLNVAATPGSIVVTSTTEFLDGSTTGAADFQAALGDSNAVSSLFPSSVYGSATVTSVSTESVSNPSENSCSLMKNVFKVL